MSSPAEPSRELKTVPPPITEGPPQLGDLLYLLEDLVTARLTTVPFVERLVPQHVVYLCPIKVKLQTVL